MMIESKTNFFRPAKIGTKLIATSKLVNKSRNPMLWQKEVRDADRKLLALVSQSQMTVPVTDH
jgi:acyl-coenzyme A thioesterase PaaI-like protein